MIGESARTANRFVSQTAMHRTILVFACACVVATCATGISPGAETEDEESLGELMRRVELPGSPSRRHEALARIGQRADARSIAQWELVPFSLQVARGKNPRIAHGAIVVLSDIVMTKDRSALSDIRGPFIAMLGERTTYTVLRMEVARQLGRMSVQDGDAHVAVKALVEVAAAGAANPPAVVGEVLVALGRIGDPAARATLRQGLLSRDDRIREQAADGYTLALRGAHSREFVKDPALGSLVTGLLAADDTPAGMRDHLIEMLSLIVDNDYKGMDALTPIVKVLREESRVSTVVNSLEAFGIVADPSSAQVLVAVYERFSPPVTEARGRDAGEVVRAQVCATTGRLFEMWSENAHGPDIAAAGKALTRLLVSALVQDASTAVKKEAAYALGNLYDARYERALAIKALIAVIAAKETPGDVKRAAADSLGFLSTDTSAPFGSDVQTWERWCAENEHMLSQLVQ